MATPAASSYRQLTVVLVFRWFSRTLWLFYLTLNCLFLSLSHSAGKSIFSAHFIAIYCWWFNCGGCNSTAGSITISSCEISPSFRLMFPLALIAQHFGMSNSRMSLNVLARSFPWIGIHVDVLRTGGRRLTPLFRSHMLFLLIQSFVPGQLFKPPNWWVVLLSILCPQYLQKWLFDEYLS